jgi:hypothetical protein
MVAMEEFSERRRLALERYRLQYELQHGVCVANERADDDDAGEDQID